MSNVAALRLGFNNQSRRLTARDKLILAGLFLSKFDDNGLQLLGFNGFSEAFNTMALSLNASPASIKNYRDEFDPYFPNARKGWHKRAIREYCKKIMDEYGDLNIDDFALLLRTEISVAGDIDIIEEELDPSEENTFAKRLLTGQAAEKYFESNYNNIHEFNGFDLINTTRFGCGFDYKMSKKESPFLAVEVKGIATQTGSIMLTNKEYKAAKILEDRFYLFIVRNFIEKPYHTIFKNPLKSNLFFDRRESTTIQITWSANI